MGWSPTLINAGFMVAIGAVAAWTLYPVYESMRFVAVAALAILGGAAIAVVAARRGWGAMGISLSTLALYAIGGLALAIPGSTSGVDTALQAGIELVRGPVTGWMDIVTLPLPLGEYRATLVPVYALFLLTSVWATTVALTSKQRWGGAAIVLAGQQAVVIAIGPATRADAYAWAPWGVFVSHEFVVGLAAFGLVLAWFAWRSAWARRAAILRAQGASGVRLVRGTTTTAMTGAGAVMAMVAVATGAGLLIAGPISAATPREVARSVVDPQLTVDSAVTPLAGYRSFFAPAQYDTVLFSVTVEEGSADRVRVATLPYFDGEAYTASAPAEVEPSRFERVPSTVQVDVPGERVDAAVEIVGGSGIWVPVVGQLESVTFSGARRSQLVDSFYYQRESGAAVVSLEGGLTAGDGYDLQATVPAPRQLSDLGEPPQAGTVSPALIPDSLRDWVANQEVSSDGAGLAELVTRLRERGYLSHSLEQPDGDAVWATDLESYTFVSSAAGHSRDRIDRLFTALNAREAEVGSDADNAELVAAAGDDEQFATAVALIASEMGFSSRVVLGARLENTDPAGFAGPACDGGECRGQNMSAWVEVQSADGAWVPVDVTPQHANPVSPDVTTQRDPEFASPLDPETAEEIVPPSSQRGTVDSEEPPPTAEEEGKAWLGPAVRIAAVSVVGLLVLLGPIFVILIWKGVRRSRRRNGDPAHAVHGGWDEYLDTAVDAGLEPMPMATRAEVAAAYGTANAVALARSTDKATFSGRQVEPEDVEEFWEHLEQDRQEWLSQRGWWSRMRMRVSLRSMWHATANTPDAHAAPSEGQRVNWRSDHTSATGTHRGRARNRTKTRPGR